MSNKRLSDTNSAIILTYAQIIAKFKGEIGADYCFGKTTQCKMVKNSDGSYNVFEDSQGDISISPDGCFRFEGVDTSRDPGLFECRCTFETAPTLWDTVSSWLTGANPTPPERTTVWFKRTQMNLMNKPGEPRRMPDPEFSLSAARAYLAGPRAVKQLAAELMPDPREQLATLEEELASLKEKLRIESAQDAAIETAFRLLKNEDDG